MHVLYMYVNDVYKQLDLCDHTSFDRSVWTGKMTIWQEDYIEPRKRWNR
jgi:hypothetical protein